jgi:hypothetical protein
MAMLVQDTPNEYGSGERAITQTSAPDSDSKFLRV